VKFEQQMKVSSLKLFLETCEKENWPSQHIVHQLYLFTQGVEDSQLHDTCIILKDGTYEILMKGCED